ncbi:MAG: hypothetical protein AAGD14_07325 [Planctomycetota bacterium]
MRALAVLLLLTPFASAQTFEQRYQEFSKYIRRPTLNKRVKGIEFLAASGDVRALTTLAKVYGKPPAEPKDQTRYITASIAWDRFGEPEHVDAWEAWRTKFKKPRDAWLWYRALDVVTINRGPETAMRVIKGKKDNLFLRMAALHSVGVFHEPVILPLISELLDKTKARGLERSLLVEACGRALVRQVNEQGTDEYRRAALKLMKQFDLKETPARTRWVLARCFARIFKTEQVYLDSSEPWRILLRAEDAKRVKIDPRYAPPKRPSFVGIEATGKRIVYVIDMSDSMCTPLNPREKQNIGPVSGTREKDDEKKKGDANPLKGEQGLDWKKIKNRFDAAREYLIRSLKSLEPDMEYCVIWFGSDADYFRSTPGLMKATQGQVMKTIGELRAIRPGPKGGNRPHGTLKGNTNIHGGFLRAFALRGKTKAKRHAYVDAKTFDTGADTIFLLSDGDPSWDDWAGTDSRDQGDRVGDPEMGGGGNQNATSLNFPGPYARNRHLLEDLQRMNLFRQVEVHCIGIGEASRGYLSSLANAGLGRVRMIGKGPSHRGTKRQDEKKQ